MKSAYELALERAGGELRSYSDEDKEALAEVDRKYDAKVAQARFDAEARRADSTDPEQQQRFNEDLAVELASLERRREQDKEKIRGVVTAGDEPSC